jgi:hypothetical protein
MPSILLLGKKLENRSAVTFNFRKRKSRIDLQQLHSILENEIAQSTVVTEVLKEMLMPKEKSSQMLLFF